MRRVLTTTLLLASAAALLSGCMTSVRPWERELLARRDMAWDSDPLEAQRRNHVYWSKEAALGGGGSTGGGCGCN